MREMTWSEAEKSRQAFDVVLEAELAEVLHDFKARAAAALTPAAMWADRTEAALNPPHSRRFRPRRVAHATLEGSPRLHL